MSNADYSVTGQGSFCTIANLDGDVSFLDTVFTITLLKSTGPNDRYVGMAVLIDDEIVRLESFSNSSITVARGCADTVPALHFSGAEIWFFEDTLSSDGVDYVSGSTVGVKVLPATTSATMPIEYSPPQSLTFSSRFARPYPPGNLQIDGQPWCTAGLSLTTANPTLSFTWAHRNRVTQQDVLVSHTEASVTPEAGTTYTIEVRRASNATLLRTVTGISGSSWDYTRSMANVDLPGETGNVDVWVDLFSMRDGFASLQKYRATLTVEPSNINLLDFGWQGAYSTNAAERSITSADALITFTGITTSSGHFGDRTKVDLAGKVYCEFELVAQNNDFAWHCFGIIPTAATTASQSNNGSYGISSRSPNVATGCGINFISGTRVDGTMVDGASYSFVAGDRIGIAVDTVARKVWFRKNGSWIAGNPAAGTGESFIYAAGTYRFAWLNYLCNATGSHTSSARIYPSASQFLHAAPSGFAPYAE